MSNKIDTFDYQNQQICVLKSMHHTLRLIPSTCALTITLVSIHPKTSQCHSERSEESLLTPLTMRFFVALLLRMTS